MRTSPVIAPRIVLPVMCVLAVLLYAPSLPLHFCSDDFYALYKLGVRGDLRIGSFFRPLPDLSLYLTWKLAGPATWAYRIVNVLLLGINAWLVHRLVRSVHPDRDAAPNVALLAGLLFLVYPFHSEPQFWIIARNTALAATFTLAALVIALSEASLVRRAIGVAIGGTLGGLCYESALLLPLLLAAMWPFFRNGQREGWALLVAIAGGVVILNVLARNLITGHVANAYGASFFTLPWSAYPARSVKAAMRLFLPPLDNESQQTWRAAALFVVLVLIVIAVRRRCQRSTDRTTLLVFLLLTVIALIIAAVGGVSTRTSESDRFLYLPAAFLTPLVAMVLHRLLRGRALIGAVASIVALCLVGVYDGHRRWATASEIVERTIANTPEQPAVGRLLVHHFPGDHQGAFIFRHGFQEALIIAGRNADRIVPLADGPAPVGARIPTLEGDTVVVLATDMWHDVRSALRP